MISHEAEIFIWISPLRAILGGSRDGLPTGLQDLVYIWKALLEKLQVFFHGLLAGSKFRD